MIKDTGAPQSRLFLLVCTAMCLIAILVPVIPFALGSTANSVHNLNQDTNYLTIQQAIDGAHAGDTLFVNPGIYSEHILVGKQVSLIGANRESVTINGGGAGYSIVVASDAVSISGFTVTGGGWSSASPYGGGLLIKDSSYVNITDNVFTGNEGLAIYLLDSSDLAPIGHNVIQGNLITNNKAGIGLYNSWNDIIAFNRITNNGGGIGFTMVCYDQIYGNVLSNSGGIGGGMFTGNTIYHNTFTHCGQVGLDLQIQAWNNNISSNEISYNQNGIKIGDMTGDNVFTNNTIAGNTQSGVSAYSDTNQFYLNYFINNTVQATAGQGHNEWDESARFVGNYWSDYTGKDTNHDGIGETSYVINSQNIDHYPLILHSTPTMDANTETLNGGKVTINQTETTGVAVEINDPLAADGASITLNAINYGSNQPPETGDRPISVGGTFYDVKILSSDTLNGEAVVYVNFTSPGFVDGNQIMYWNQTSWVAVPTSFYSPHTLCGTFTASQLQGTPVFVTPEYAFGGLSVLIASIAAFALLRKRRSQ